MVWPKTTRVAAARETQTARVPKWWFDVADLRLICLGVGPGVARSWLQSCPTCRVGASGCRLFHRGHGTPDGLSPSSGQVPARLAEVTEPPAVKMSGARERSAPERPAASRMASIRPEILVSVLLAVATLALSRPRPPRREPGERRTAHPRAPRPRARGRAPARAAPRAPPRPRERERSRDGSRRGDRRAARAGRRRSSS